MSDLSLWVRYLHEKEYHKTITEDFELSRIAEVEEAVAAVPILMSSPLTSFLHNAIVSSAESNEPLPENVICAKGGEFLDQERHSNNLVQCV